MPKFFTNLEPLLSGGGGGIRCKYLTQCAIGERQDNCRGVLHGISPHAAAALRVYLGDFAADKPQAIDLMNQVDHHRPAPAGYARRPDSRIPASGWPTCHS